MQLAPHGRLTRGGFSGSDGLLLPRVVNERRVRERVGQRGAVFDRDGVAAWSTYCASSTRCACSPIRKVARQADQGDAFEFYAATTLFRRASGFGE